MNENIYIPYSEVLHELSLRLGVRKKDLAQKILDGFIELEFDIDERNDAGVELSVIISEHGYQVGPVAAKILKRSDNEINDLFGGLFFKNILDECPLCGCELEYREQNAWGQEWTDCQCTNPNCDHVENNEPDWDLTNDR